MNTNLSNTETLGAVERLTRNIDRINMQQGKEAHIHVYSSVVCLGIYFDNGSQIERTFATANTDEINTFNTFLEGSSNDKDVTPKGVKAA